MYKVSELRDGRGICIFTPDVIPFVTGLKSIEQANRICEELNRLSGTIPEYNLLDIALRIVDNHDLSYIEPLEISALRMSYGDAQTDANWCARKCIYEAITKTGKFA